MEKIKIKLNAGVVLVALIVFFAFAGVAGAEDWPMFMHDLEHTGETSDVIENPEDLELKWKFMTGDFGDLVESSPSVSENYVYICSKHWIYCLDKTNGELIWKFEAEGSLDSSPAVSGNYVYTGSDGNYIYCLDKNTGELKWKFRTGCLFSFGLNYKQYLKEGEVNEQIRKIFENKEIYLSNFTEISKINDKNWRIGDRKEYYFIEEDNKELNVYEIGYSSSSSPAVSRDYVYVGSADDYIYCLDKNTGELKWKFKTARSVDSSPAVFGDYVYVGSIFYIYCLDKNTGKEIWKFKTEGDVSSSPAVSGNYIYVGSDDHYLYCINKNTGELIWKFEKFKSGDDISFFESSPAVSEDYVYIGSIYGYIYCIDKNTGKLIWKFEALADVETSPAISGSYVYIVSNEGVIYCLDKYTGELIRKIEIGNYVRSSPVVSGNYVYIGSWMGYIYAFGTEGPKQLNDYIPNNFKYFLGFIFFFMFLILVYFIIKKYFGIDLLKWIKEYLASFILLIFTLSMVIVIYLFNIPLIKEITIKEIVGLLFYILGLLYALIVELPKIFQKNKTKHEDKADKETHDKKSQSKPEPTENSKVLSTLPIISDIKVSNSSIVEGESVEFSAKVTAKDMFTLNYLWDFGDGITSIGTDVSHQFLNPNKYKVTLKVTDKKGQNAFKSVIIYVEDIIKKEAAEIIVNEDDIQKILGYFWRYSKDTTTTSKVRENRLSWYDHHFSSNYANLNQKGSVRGGLSLEVSVTVFRSSKEAKNEFENDKRIFGNEKDYVAEEFNVGDEGFSSIWLKGDKNIPVNHYSFLKKNVLVTMAYGYEISGKSEEIDKKYLEDNHVLSNLGINGINEIRLAKLQESRISDK